jgi:hypothetical protein
VSDLWRPELLPSGQSFARTVTRERPILDEQPVGPLRAHIAVVPITDAGPRVLFAVEGQWPAPELAGPPPARTLMSDNYVTPDRELAIGVARRAIDTLRAGLEPDLAAIARVLKER